MNCVSLHERIEAFIRSDLRCSPARDDVIAVTLPFTYPDGDNIELIISSADRDRVRVSDAGGTLARLASVDVSVRSPRVRDALGEIARGYSISLSDTDELVTTATALDVSAAVFAVACAALRADALAVLESPQRSPSFPSKVAEYLAATFSDRLLTARQVVGRTGSPYSVTGQLALPSGPPLLVIAIGPRASEDSRQIDHALRVWWDVNGQTSDRRKVSMLALPPSSYPQHDLAALDSLSTLASWDRRQYLVDYVESDLQTDPRLLAAAVGMF